MATDLDKAEKELKNKTKGFATVSRKDMPKFSERDLEKIRKARKRIKAIMKDSK